MAIVGIVLFALLLLAVPIGIALSSAAAAYIMVDPLLETTVIFRQFFSFIGRYSLTAIPLFIFAGFLMEKTGLIRQLFAFADSLVGHLPGGFGVATVLACVLFGSISGSSVAMAAAMSVIAIPEMKKRGYPDWLSGGLVATAGGIAILIPPSIPLLIYGIVTETSVVRLFFAGVIPGLLLAAGNIISVIVIALWLKLPRSGKFDGGPRAAGVEGRAARARHAGGHPGRAVRRRVHPHRGGRGGLRLRDGLRPDRWTGRVRPPAPAHRDARDEPHRRDPVPHRQRRRVPVPRRQHVLAAAHHRHDRRLGIDPARLHLRLHGRAADPGHVRRRRGDDPAHRAGDLSRWPTR